MHVTGRDRQSASMQKAACAGHTRVLPCRGSTCTVRKGRHFLKCAYSPSPCSFTWGVKVAGDVISRPGLAAPGLMLLVGGIAGIALNGQLASRRSNTEGELLGTSHPCVAPLRTPQPLQIAGTWRESMQGAHWG